MRTNDAESWARQAARDVDAATAALASSRLLLGAAMAGPGSRWYPRRRLRVSDLSLFLLSASSLRCSALLQHCAWHHAITVESRTRRI
jgi:hypothetical protein